eukprot:TRINITY_DN71181_c0_g1_i1.p1 TRINITY_DN71181_c0_g1~~TRINITY_DN71181_c0_g1_i1.p1  ORF type:complete len:409 (-),score=41.42 TRINITY_DN71181_c0_g1_i1:59-1168(-)
MPACVVPSVVDSPSTSTCYESIAVTERCRSRACLRYDAAGSAIVDMDAVESLLEWWCFDGDGADQDAEISALRTRRCSFFHDMPMLVPEPNAQSKRSRQRDALVELLFEKFDVPATFLARNAVLSAFAFGQSSAFVVDVGAGLSSAAAVSHGMLVPSGLREIPFAGRALDQALATEMRRRGILLSPKRSCSASAARESAIADDELRRAEDMKETICFCHYAPITASSQEEQFMHSLPDGQRIDVAPFSRAIPEQLLVGAGSVPALLAESVKACTERSIKDAIGSIVLTGGSSYFVNLKTRVESALVGSSAGVGLLPLPLARRTRFLFDVNRRYSTWLGGSVLASISSTKWVSKSEYSENGSDVLCRRSS